MGNKPSADSLLAESRIEIQKARHKVEISRIVQDRDFVQLRLKTVDAAKKGNMHVVKTNSQHLERILMAQQRTQLQANSLISMEQDVLLQQTQKATFRAMESVTRVASSVANLQMLTDMKMATEQYTEARDQMRTSSNLMDEAMMSGEERTTASAREIEEQMLAEVALEEQSFMPFVPSHEPVSKTDKARANQVPILYGK